MIKKRFLAQIGLLVIALAFLFVPVNHKISATTYDLFGSAWSENIGWVTFNCVSTNSCDSGNTEYKVTMDGSTGELSGYAWSDNIGWILFDPSTSITACGDVVYSTTACIPKINLVTGRFSGFARALAYGGGWSGWIDLSGATASSINAQGLRLVSGNTWGSDVVGWLDMSGVTVGGDAPISSVTLNANPTSVSTYNGSYLPSNQTTLSWSGTNISNCVASSSAPRADWTGSVSISGTKTVQVGTSVTYIITCTNTITNAPISSNVLVTAGAGANNLYIRIFNPPLGNGTVTSVTATNTNSTPSIIAHFWSPNGSVDVNSLTVDTTNSGQPSNLQTSDFTINSIYECNSPSVSVSLPVTTVQNRHYCVDVSANFSSVLPPLGAYKARLKVRDTANDNDTSNDMFVDIGGFAATKKIKVIER